MIEKQPAVFLDRDGTLNEMVYYEDHGLSDSPFTPGKLSLKPQAGRFIAGLNSAGFKVFVITNQPGIAKGTLTKETLFLIHRKLEAEVAKQGGHLDGIYYCPHHPEGSPQGDNRYIKVCECRKPLPGLITLAVEEHNIDLSSSYVVGDGIVDIEAGKQAGCKTILISNLKLHMLEIMFKKGAIPDILVKTLVEALDDILQGKAIHPFPLTKIKA